MTVEYKFVYTKKTDIHGRSKVMYQCI